jgi:hypothetical protein
MPRPVQDLARDLARSVTQWTPGIRPTWTISDVRNALRQHADGDFSLSAQLVDTMGEDDVLPGLFEKRVDAVLGSDFELQAVEAPNRQLSQRIADRFGPLWWDTFPESEQSEFLGWYRKLGIGIATLDWDRGGSTWTARLRTLHPQFLRRDNYRGRWIYSAHEGELEVTPGDGRWLLLIDGNRGWMNSAVRALAVTWISKQLGLRDWNRYNERHGLPIIKAFAPAIADDPDQEAFWNDLKSLGSETVAQLVTDLGDKGAKFDLDLLEAKDNSWQTFQALLERADRRFMVRVLGSNLSTEVSGTGSLAATKVHRGVEQSKANADAQKLSTELRRQGLYPIVTANMQAALEVMPWPKWDTAPPEDDKGNAEAAEVFGKALVQLGKAGYEVENLDEVQERYGLKLVKKAPPEPPKPTPAQPDDDSIDVDFDADEEDPDADADAAAAE